MDYELENLTTHYRVLVYLARYQSGMGGKMPYGVVLPEKTWLALWKDMEQFMHTPLSPHSECGGYRDLQINGVWFVPK